MNLSELVGNKLPEIKKILFGSDDTSAEVEVTDETSAFLDAKLVDGTIVRIEPAVEVGASVKVIDEEANELDAPDGDHELEDGTVIRTEGAVITEVIAAEVEEEAPEAEAEEVDEDMSSEEIDVEVKMAAIAADVVAAEKFASAEAVEGINDRFAEVEKAISMITDIVEKMAAKPSVEPTKKVVNPFSRPTTDADLVEKMRKALKK
tara:strand:- start:1322 stop:1939 length:618 start_codon:yes stop_codon:yes gene_type:complete